MNDSLAEEMNRKFQKMIDMLDWMIRLRRVVNRKVFRRFLKWDRATIISGRHKSGMGRLYGWPAAGLAKIAE